MSAEDHSFDERKDPLGARMKERYENVTRIYLPRRSWSICRIDGRSFHTYTKGLERPYDEGLHTAIGETMAHLAGLVSGCALGYCQSDEISLLLCDFATEATEPFFGGNVQKIASVVASMTTAYFNSIYKHPQHPDSLATFDARVFSLPTAVEAANYMLWRQQDATRNAVSMIGQVHFSPTRLHGLSTPRLRESLRGQDVDVDGFPEEFLRGQVAERQTVLRPVEYTDKQNQLVQTAPVERRIWVRSAAPPFQGLEWLLEHIPDKPEN